MSAAAKVKDEQKSRMITHQKKPATENQNRMSTNKEQKLGHPPYLRHPPHHLWQLWQHRVLFPLRHPQLPVPWAEGGGPQLHGELAGGAPGEAWGPSTPPAHLLGLRLLLLAVHHLPGLRHHRLPQADVGGPALAEGGVGRREDRC